MKIFALDEVPEQILKIVTAKGGANQGTLTLNDDQDVVYRLYGDVLLPCVLWHGGLVEVVETTPSRKQDAGDLHEYPMIIRLARNGVGKDERTNRWVNTIHDQFVLRLLTKAYFGYLPRELVLQHRGMVDQAKFTALRIWRAGSDAKSS